MIKIYKDKAQTFEFGIKVDGASLKNTKGRLILEQNGLSLLIEGAIDDDGKCKINIPSFSNIDVQEGNVYLEVIVNNSIFKPWQDKFVLAESVKVENISENLIINDNQPKVSAKIVSNSNQKYNKIDYKTVLKESIEVFNRSSQINKKRILKEIQSFKPSNNIKEIAKNYNSLIGNLDSNKAKLFMYTISKLENINSE